jgi:peptidoglycan/xylan/chitin deacetylase (PgdA/CDA1 family)
VRTTGKREAAGGALRSVAARLMASRAIIGALARVPSGGGVILRYHSVNDDPGWSGDYIQPSLVVAPQVFDRQISYLTSRYRIVGMDELVGALRGGRRIDGRAVAITFDDGYEDNHRFALPILLKHGAPATFYVTTGAVGDETVLWTVKLRHAIRRSREKSLTLSFLNGRAIDISTPDHKESSIKLLTGMVKRVAAREARAMLEEMLAATLADTDRPPQRVMMNWEEIRELHRSGMTIGAHTVAHLNLPCLETADVVREVRGSKEALDRALESPVVHFAYPNGRTERNFDARVACIVADAGFLSAVTCVNGPVSQRFPEYAIPRLGVRESDHDLARFASAIQRARLMRPRHPDVEEVRRRGPS